MTGYVSRVYRQEDRQVALDVDERRLVAREIPDHLPVNSDDRPLTVMFRGHRYRLTTWHSSVRVLRCSNGLQWISIPDFLLCSWTAA